MKNFGRLSVRLGAGALLVVVASALMMRMWARPHAAPGQVDQIDRIGQTGHSAPVLVELFTSEGCSSCPPADALLAKLDATQFVPGARAIVLSEHVTYWNSLGWRDPFSFEAMTERQQHYAQRLGLDSAYTPQAVVDGAAEFVGSDQRKLTSAVAHAAAAPKVALNIDHAEIADGQVTFSLHGRVPSGATVMAALAEDAVRSSVARGENGGRTLQHTAVVRTLEEMSSNVVDGHNASLKLPGVLQSATSKQLRLVVFLVDRRSGRVLGADERAVNR